MPTVTRRAEGVYQVKIRRGPLKPRYVTMRGSEAKAHTVAEHLQAAKSLLPMPPDTPLGDWLRRYVASNRTISNATRVTYLRVINNWIDPEARKNPWLGRMPVDRIQPLHAGHFINYMLDDRELSAAALRKAFELIRTGLEAAVAAGMILSNPFPRRALPTTAKLRVVPSRDQVARIALLGTAADPPDEKPDWRERTMRVRLLLTLAAHMGARVGELVALTWGAIDMRAASMRINQSLEVVAGQAQPKLTKTAASGRTLSVPPFVLAELRDAKLEAIRNRQPGEDIETLPVLPARGGGWWRPDAASQQALRAMRRIGIPGSVHCLRHAHATMLLSLGNAHPQQVRQRLGHADIRTTLGIYGKAIPADDRKLADIVTDLMTVPAGGREAV